MDPGIRGPRKLDGTGLRAWLKPERGGCGWDNSEAGRSRCGLGLPADIRVFKDIHTVEGGVSLPRTM